MVHSQLTHLKANSVGPDQNAQSDQNLRCSQMPDNLCFTLKARFNVVFLNIVMCLFKYNYATNLMKLEFKIQTNSKFLSFQHVDRSI